MGAKTGIEWTDATWNPIRGCSRVSEGCRHCYAESMAARFSGPGLAYDGLAVMQNGKPHWTGKVEFVEKHLLDPLKWKTPRRIFVNSMSDLFHENVTDEMRDKIFAVMALCPQHTLQVLTKRPARMLEYLTRRTDSEHYRLGSKGDEERQFAFACRVQSQIVELFDKVPAKSLITASNLNSLTPWFPLPNVWLGVSVENQKAAHERIPLLLQTPAAVRFISAEPLLGAVDLWDSGDGPLAGGHPEQADIDSDRGVHFIRHGTSRLDWVICGGESGRGARPMKAEWARSLRDQCASAGVPFFFKQWGEYLPSMQDGSKDAPKGQPFNCSDQSIRVGKKNAGSQLDGVEYKQFPVVHS